MLVGEPESEIKRWCRQGTPKEMHTIMEEALLIINSDDPAHRALLFPEPDRA